MCGQKARTDQWPRSFRRHHMTIGNPCGPFKMIEKKKQITNCGIADTLFGLVGQYYIVRLYLGRNGCLSQKIPDWLK